LHRLACALKVGGVRKNPTPTKGVAAWYEEKETALRKGREAGGAMGSRRDSKKAQDVSPESQTR
jgi:hypothetical protein